MYAVSMMVSGSLMIIVIEIVRRFAGSRLPRGAFYALWLIVCARLLIPFRLPWSSSFFSLVDRIWKNATGGRSVIFGADGENAGLSVFWSAQSDGSAVQFAAENGYIHYTIILKAVWILGAAALAVYFAVVYAKNVYKFRESLPVDAGAAYDLRKRMRIRRRVAVRESDYISSPLTYGMLRPVILLPACASEIMERAELEHIFAHELVHIKRFDAVTKVVLTAAVCAYWFDPFVWVMYVLFNRDIELSCDAAAVRILGESSKADYAMTLVRFAELKEMSVFSFNSFGKSVLTQRVNAIMTGGKKGAVSLAAALLLCVLVFALFATSSDIKAKSTVRDNAAQLSTGQQQLEAEGAYGLLYDKGAGSTDSVRVNSKFKNGSKNPASDQVKGSESGAVDAGNGIDADINASGDNLYEFDSNASYENMVPYEPGQNENDDDKGGASSDSDNKNEISSSPENMS